MAESSDLQPLLSDELITLRPLKSEDFEILYALASDPLIWEQHPNKNRFQRDVFQNFFNGAMESNGAFIVFSNRTGEPIGSSRFCGFDPDKKSIEVGYTFLARAYWGTTYNRSLKTLMLDYAFRFVERVEFHIGAVNIRSQKAIEKLGAIKIDEFEVAYYGEPAKLNFIYEMSRENWLEIRKRYS